jgi:hypothetical protein
MYRHKGTTSLTSRAAGAARTGAVHSAKVTSEVAPDWMQMSSHPASHACTRHESNHPTSYASCCHPATACQQHGNPSLAVPPTALAVMLLRPWPPYRPVLCGVSGTYSKSSGRPASHACSSWSAIGISNRPTCCASYSHPATCCHTHSWCIRSFRTPDRPCCCPAASLAAVPPGHSQAPHPAPCCCCLWLPSLLLLALAHSCPRKALPKAALHRHSGASPRQPPDLRTNSSRAQASKHARVHARKAHTRNTQASPGGETTIEARRGGRCCR